MGVDWSKKRVLLAIPGVSGGKHWKKNQHTRVRKLLKTRMNGMRLPVAVKRVDIEKFSDDAIAPYLRVMDALGEALHVRAPITGFLSGVVDIIADVVLALQNGSTAAAIRKELRAQIDNLYDRGYPCYLLAGSLASIYAFDILDEYIDEGRINQDDRRDWPVQGLVTVGSPLGLKMFKRRKVRAIEGFGPSHFQWHNMYDSLDPVVSGHVFGKPNRVHNVAESFLPEHPDPGWSIRDHVVDTHKAWLFAHTSYWDKPQVGDTLLTMMSS